MELGESTPSPPSSRSGQVGGRREGGGRGARSLARAPSAECGRQSATDGDDDFSTSSNFKRRPAAACASLPRSLPRRVDRSTPSPIALEEIELLRKEGRKEGSGFDMAEEEDWIEKRRASGGTRERERERETRRNLDAASSNGAKG